MRNKNVQRPNRSGTRQQKKDASDQIKVKKWLATRKKAGRKIDPETAGVLWEYGLTLDPYGVESELPEECRQVGRNYFARAPGSDTWVEFGDLPAATRYALWEKHKATLAFPAGLLARWEAAHPTERNNESKILIARDVAAKQG